VFDVKGDVIAILNYCGIDDKSLTTTDTAPSYYHSSRSGTIMFGRKKLAYFGELHPKIEKLFDIREKIVCFEVFAEQLPLFNTRSTAFNKKVFPKIVRDFAFLFPAKTYIGNTVNSIYKLDQLISDVSIFDCFDFDITHKSIGISVTLDAVDRTLTEEEASVISDKIVKYIEDAGGELRRKK
jgi:phenylalanyl-tRNA synthetase beta chain